MNGNGISDVEVSEYDTRTKEYVTSDNFIAEQISDEDDTIWTLSILDDSEAAVLRKNRILLSSKKQTMYLTKWQDTVCLIRFPHHMRPVRFCNVIARRI